MTTHATLRERICLFARSLYDRGLTHGSTGNISARTEDGSLLVTPTGSSFGFLDPAALAHLDSDGNHLSGSQPTKEVGLHMAFYTSLRPETGAVVHLHSHHTVALSTLPEVDPDNMLPPITPYATMQLGHVRLLPYFRPGDPEMANAVAALDPKITAAVLANHGPVVAGTTLDRAVFAMEELEETARLALTLRGQSPRHLTDAQIADLVRVFNIDT